MTPPWKFIPIQEYRLPSNGGHAVHGFWQRLAEFLWEKRGTSSSKRPKESGPVSDEVLARMVHQPNWNGMVTALSDVLSFPREVDKRNHQARAVVGPPGSSVYEAMLGWAQEYGACVVAPPVPEQILGSPDWWHHVRDNPAEMIVIPQMERCFIRHHDGLTGLRQLLQWLWIKPRPIVVGCDSWAWAYLIRALHVDAVFHQPLAPAPFDGAQLKEWIGESHPPSEVRTDDAYWDSLASVARGVPGTAWHLHRQGLVHDGSVISMPEMPHARGSVQALILHALLIHNGLSADDLLGLLPFPTGQIMAGVAWLENHRLLENKQDRWQVTLNAYGCVRRFLGNEGFLVDSF